MMLHLFYKILITVIADKASYFELVEKNKLSIKNCIIILN